MKADFPHMCGRERTHLILKPYQNGCGSGFTADPDESRVTDFSHLRQIGFILGDSSDVAHRDVTHDRGDSQMLS